LAADLIVGLLVGAVEAEIDGREAGEARGRRPDELQKDSKRFPFVTIWKEYRARRSRRGRLRIRGAAWARRRERDLVAFVNGLRLGERLPDDGEREVFGLLLRVSKAMLAVELTAVGQVQGDPGGGHIPPFGELDESAAVRLMSDGRWAYPDIVRPVMLGPIAVNSVAFTTARFLMSLGGS
jgi:hypothetical protein